MGRKPRRKFEEKEIKQLESMYAMRLPGYQMAAIMGYATEEALTSAIKGHDGLRQRMEAAKAGASQTTRRTLYDMAVGRKPSKDPLTGEITQPIAPDFRALKFWLNTNEGMSETKNVQLTGLNGAPIETVNLTAAERDTRLAQLRELNDLLADDDE